MTGLKALTARPWQAWLLAVLIALGGLAARFAVEPALQGGYPFITFFPAVALAAYLCGARPALLTMAIGAAASWHFLIGPESAFVLGVQASVALALYVAISLVVIAITHALQSANAQLAAEREVSRLLAENRETLFRELQHRVGNNLQMVSALLALQRRKASDPEAQGALDQAARRLGLIGRVHRRLYQPDGAPIALVALLGEVVRDVIDAAGREDVACMVEGGADQVVPPDLAIPVTLIVAEAVTNAIEHGLGARGGAVRITVARGAGGLSVTVEDDGCGLPAGFALDGSAGLGLQLASSLASHHRGTLSLASEHGATRATLTIPVDQESVAR